MKDLVIKYGKQPSTYRGLAILLGAFGIFVSPESVEAVGTVVASVIGAVEVIRNEGK
jgi:hypothetical protein